MSWLQRRCPVCSGHKKIHIGRNLDNQFEKVKICPHCKGLGWLSINQILWLKLLNRLTKEKYE